MKIYVASSWRNLYQPDVVKVLRQAGHDVYDFRAPVPGDEGFHWSEIDGGWMNWTVAEYAKALEHPVAARGFANDMSALDAADLVVLVLPSGRSASWEYGYWCGKTGQQGIVHCPEKVEPELMYRGSLFTWTMEGLVSTVGRWKLQSINDRVVSDLKVLRPTPNLPFDVWSAIGQLVVQPAVELVIEDEHGGVLLTHRKDEHWDAWHIPGGFMSPGESFQAACSRTARRELGVDVTFSCVIDVASWSNHPYVNMISLFCRATIDRGGVPADGSFFAPDKLPDVIVPAHAEFLARRRRLWWGR
jgi:ADP-ribose pyrophosphatase YjhB (NUDIX family)